MILSFRCPPMLKERTEALIATGLYSDFSAFCVAALENQLLLEEAHSNAKGRGVPLETQTLRQGGISSGKRLAKGETVREGRKRRDMSRTGAPSSSSYIPPLPLDGRATTKESNEPHLVGTQTISPDLVLAHLSAEPPFALPSVLSDVFQTDQEIPVERWLFGQYNRLLPAKVSIRALAVISMEGKDALTLEAVAPRIAEAAAHFGSYLQSVDRRFSYHRDDAFATAFPELGVEGQKGRVRYQNHFVGHTVKGEQGGLLVGLKLAVIQVIKNKPHILPTTAGWEFARLPNPLLDTPISEGLARLSGEEIEWLLRRIMEHVPVELFAYRVILSLVSEGRRTPESLNQGLALHLSPGKKLSDEEDFVSTQRTGVLGRMGDLSLVGRERQSTRMTYYLTPGGKIFLDKVGSISEAPHIEEAR